MKCIRNILSLILTAALIISLAAAPAFAENTAKTAGKLVGDCSLFLPDSDAIQVIYNLVDANGNDVSDNVVYSVTSDDATWQTWLDVDAATGDVYVSSRAAGKSFTVTAESNTYKASQIVNVSSDVFCTDFENGIPAWITPEQSISSACTIYDEGTNKYMYFAGKGNYAAPQKTIDFKNFSFADSAITGIATSHLTVEMKFLTAPTKNNDDVRQPLSISWYREKGIINGKSGTSMDAYWTGNYDANTKTSQLVVRNINPSGSTDSIVWYSSTTSVGGAYANDPDWYSTTDKKYSGFTFADMKIEIMDNIRVTTVNGTRKQDSEFINRVSGATLADANVTSMSLGGPIDDLKIYTGEKVSHAFKTGLKIEGESNILRAPVGSAAKISYSLAIDDTGLATEVPADVLWSVSSRNGVSVADAEKGEVTVNGDAAAGVFTVTAKSSDGTVLATKDVTVIEFLTPWTCANKNRIFNDMENATHYGEGVASAVNNSKTYSAYTTNSAGLGSVGAVEKDSNGNITNRYISSQGRMAYSKDGSGVMLRPYDWADGYDYRKTNQQLTFEGKFMIESSVLESALDPWSIFFVDAEDTSTYTNKAELDIRYDDLGEGVVGVYLYENGKGYNGELVDGTWVNCEGKLIGLVGIDEWFNLRVEADYAKKLYNIFIDDVLVAKDIAIGDGNTFRRNANIRSGCAIDDIAMYTGSKVATTLSAGDHFAVLKDGVKQSAGTTSFTWSEATAEDSTSTATAIIMSDSKDYSGNSLLVTIYNANGALVDVKLAPVVKSNAGISLAATEASGRVDENGSAKVFIWNTETLVPFNK